MKNKTAVLIILIMTFVMCIVLNEAFSRSSFINSKAYENRINLVIDAGHGGIDAGTSGTDGSAEKTVNLEIALTLRDFARVCGIPAFLTRERDELVYHIGDDRKRSDLYNRMDIVNSYPDSVLISIHQNHFENESEWGMQVWYSPNDNTSGILADDILEITKNNLQPDNKRKNKQSDSSYYLLYNASVPSVMVECGFMSNKEENKKLNSSLYQRQLAYSIASGLNKYITEEL
jgi:N-acetylmuramoyl-L-alanine amidase